VLAASGTAAFASSLAVAPPRLILVATSVPALF